MQKIRIRLWLSPALAWMAALLIGAAEEIDLPDVDESLRVVAREVRLHVLDDEGDHVSGLTAADFVLRENGEIRDILFFEEVDFSNPNPTTGIPAANSGETPIAELEQDTTIDRVLVLLIDSANMDESHFQATISSIRKFLNDQPPGGQLIKIIHLDQELIHVTPFTASPSQARAALERIDFSGFLRRDLARWDRRIARDIGAFVTEVNRWYKSPFMSGNIVRPTVSLSEILQRVYLNPVSSSVLTEAVRQSEHNIAQINAHIRRKEELKLEHFLNLQSNLVHLAESMRYMPGHKSVFYFSGGSFVEHGGMIRKTLPLTQDVARAINRAGTTLYAFHARKPIDAAQSAAFGHNLPIDVSIMNTWSRFPRLYDTQGEWRAGGGNTVIENAQQAGSGPNLLSRDTGGRMLGSGDVDALRGSCQTLFDASARFYRLTFETQPQDSASKLDISLTKKRKDLRLVFGQTLDPEKSFADQDQRERWLACETGLLYGRATYDEIPASFSFIDMRRDDAHRLPVYLHLQAPPKKDTRYLVGFAAVDADYQWLDRTITTVVQRTGPAKPLITDMLLPQGRIHRLRCYLRDLTDGRESLITLRLEDTEVPANAALFMEDKQVEKLIPIHHLRKEEQTDDSPFAQWAQERKDRDPFWFDDFLFVPDPQPQYACPTMVNVCFFVRAERFEDEQARFFVSDRGKLIPLSGRIMRRRLVDEEFWTLLASIRLPRLTQGSYEFLVELSTQDTEPGFLVHPFDVTSTKEMASPADAGESLFSLAKTGRASDLDQAVASGADLTAVDASGNSLLLAALQYDNTDLARALIDRGVDVHVKNHRGTTALHLSAAWGNHHMVAELLAQGVDVDASDLTRNTPLFYASEAGNVDVVRLLIANGSHVNHRNAKQETALFHAAINNRARTVKHLMDAGADADIVDSDRRTPLIRAILQGSQKAVKRLLQSGADPDFHPPNGLTPLMISAISQQLPMCRELLDSGADINAQEMHGNTVLALVASEGFWHAAEQLIKWGAQVNAKNALGETPLMLAVTKDHVGVVRTLLEGGADIELDNQGVTPLMLAAANGYSRMTKFLLDQGADPNRRDQTGRSALDFAHDKDVRAILKYYQTQ